MEIFQRSYASFYRKADAKVQQNLFTIQIYLKLFSKFIQTAFLLSQYFNSTLYSPPLSESGCKGTAYFINSKSNTEKIYENNINCQIINEIFFQSFFSKRKKKRNIRIIQKKTRENKIELFKQKWQIWTNHLERYDPSFSKIPFTFVVCIEMRLTDVFYFLSDKYAKQRYLRFAAFQNDAEKPSPTPFPDTKGSTDISFCPSEEYSFFREGNTQ